MQSVNPLGEFIRARRAATSPKQVGLSDEGPRRTAGLRRHEVAMLAGVSEGYYARLEQGREKHPSDQVLKALTRVFGLDAEATEHLHRLARQGLRGTGGSRGSADDRAPSHLVRLIGSWSTPAVILGPRFDILAANDAARALLSVMGTERNLLRFVFLDPAARRFHLDWEEIARTRVAGLRATAALNVEDETLRALVGQLLRRSEDFTRMWAEYDVRAKTHQTNRLLHPDAGQLTLIYQSFTVNGCPGQQLGTYQAEPGSPSEAALRRLVETPAGPGSAADEQPAPHDDPGPAGGAGR
ncbi:transcriptional regulator [Streptomyces hygroscopicus subsp. hygroscopicus]|nr:helix-turn-helix transcriptional regulator [Streptomyces hygroscopicus]GLX49087.1 transcriptional regulator [Streptomyces hygroscopicus subsp. hygroscopicus]